MLVSFETRWDNVDLAALAQTIVRHVGKELPLNVGNGLAYGDFFAFVRHILHHSSRSRVFCVNGADFAAATLTPLAPRYDGVKRFYEKHGRRIIIADMQLAIVTGFSSGSRSWKPFNPTQCDSF